MRSWKFYIIMNKSVCEGPHPKDIHQSSRITPRWHQHGNSSRYSQWGFIGTHHDKLRYDVDTPPARSREIPFSLPSTPERIHVLQSVCVRAALFCFSKYVGVCGTESENLVWACVFTTEEERDRGRLRKGRRSVTVYVCMCGDSCTFSPAWTHKKTSLYPSLTKKVLWYCLKYLRVTCKYCVQ